VAHELLDRDGLPRLRAFVEVLADGIFEPQFSPIPQLEAAMAVNFLEIEAISQSAAFNFRRCMGEPPS
jgi:hypothetical protein